MKGESPTPANCTSGVPEEGPLDEEILRRLKGHLKPLMEPFLVGLSTGANLRTGLFLFVCFLAIMGGLWYSALWVIPMFMTYLIMFFVRFFLPWIAQFTEYMWGAGNSLSNRQLGDLIYSALFFLGFASTTVGLVIHSMRLQKNAYEDEAIAGTPGGAFSPGLWFGFILRLLSWFPFKAISCFRAYANPESDESDRLSLYARVALAVGTGEQPSTFERLWKAMKKRFPDAFPEENKGRVVLMGILRELGEVGLVRSEMFGEGDLSSSTVFKPSETLLELIERSRLDPKAFGQDPKEFGLDPKAFGQDRKTSVGAPKTPGRDPVGDPRPEPVSDLVANEEPPPPPPPRSETEKE